MAEDKKRERDTGIGSGAQHQSVYSEQENIPENSFLGFPSVEEFTKAGFCSLMEATRASNGLPIGHDWDLYTSYPSFQKVMDAEGRKLLQLMAMLLQHQGVNCSLTKRSLEEKLDLIIDANDTILERVGMHLDELDGILKHPEPLLVEAAGSTTTVVSGSWNKRSHTAMDHGTFNPRHVRLLAAKNIERPQAKFKEKIDNSNSAFEPRIKDKPNSLKPLAILLEETLLGEESFSHPYDYELDRFSPHPSQLMRVEPQMYMPLEETPLVEINSADQLPGLVADLLRYPEIAVDLEHHSYRTFLGLTCLLQISTRDTDYIIDTLKLRDKLHCLNEVFTKPSIVKVLHGADNDTDWLQRDLSLYLVNLFDTHQAAKLLNMPHLSLAYLIKAYCNVDVNKHFQLADWRIRPLPAELKAYAREDTHYLLYIYELMKNALLDEANGQDNLIKAVIQRGVVQCKKRYIKPIWKPDNYMDLYRRNTKLFDNRQLFALREIYNWRDATGRQEDESTGYVLPNHMLMQVSESLPREMQGILACCNPIPPLVRQNLVLIHQIILRAREQALVKIIENDRPAIQRQSRNNLESSLHCPHDLTKASEFRDDLPTLLGLDDPPDETPAKKRKLNTGETAMDVMEIDPTLMQKDEPIVSVFECVTKQFASADCESAVRERLKQVKFVSPYERCKLVQPFMQAQDQEEVKPTTASNSATSEDNVDQERVNRIKEHFREESMKMKEQETSLRTQIKASKRKHKDSLKEQKLIKVKEEIVDEPELKQEATPTTCTPKEESSATPVTEPRKKKAKKLKEPDTFEPFDYNQVDYNRFKGGGNTSNKKDDKSKKSKNKKKSFGNSSNKSFTFQKGARGRR